jgi:hypothetical protein
MHSVDVSKQKRRCLMRMRAALLAFTFACFWAPTAQANEPLLPLRVLYIGNSKTPRPGHFADFLKKHFAHVTVADREGFSPARARDADVVLFDWSQQDSKLETPPPLGGIENWSKPTVLLNSAGLLVAGHWQLIGGAG